MIQQVFGPLNASSNFETGAWSIGENESYSVQVNFTGSNVAGTLVLQASNDADKWVDVPSTSANITNSSTQLYSEGSAQWLYVRLKWTYASGTGNVSGIMVAKQPERFNR